MFQMVSNPFEGPFAVDAQHLIGQYTAGLNQAALWRLEREGLEPALLRRIYLGDDPLSAWQPELSTLRLTLKANTPVHEFLEIWNQQVETLERTRAAGLSEDVIHLGGARALRRASVTWIKAQDPEHYELLDQSEEAWLSAKGRMCEVIQFMATELPEYLNWVTLLFREVAPMQGMENGSRSASFFNRHGQIHLSLPESLVALMTVLVHECSHQHFHLLMSCHPLTVKGAPESYSILKERKRPLLMLLLGYHAFGNVLLALRLLKQRLTGAIIQEVDKQMNHMRMLVDSLADSIEQTGLQYFEKAGLDVYEPLKTRLRFS